MKISDLDVKDDADFKGIDEEHKTIFNFIDKLHDIANQPKYHEYAIVILNSFIVFFVEHAIKEEQLLQHYLPAKLVDKHVSLHQDELNYLDESLKTLSVELSSINIQAIAEQLELEFKTHIFIYDKNIMKKLMEVKRTRKTVIESVRIN